ncbi:MAG: PSP1 domain-containing protein, partial [Candidatus Adiutrix sp.]
KTGQEASDSSLGLTTSDCQTGPTLPLAKTMVPPPKGRRVLRLATDDDLSRFAENQVREQEAFEYCLSRVAAQGLDLKLVAVEVVFDGSKTIFYYTAEDRVDFRLLVKELVSRFRTRIEMRQIGVRHEARMLGGLGTCGRSFCCAGFLSNFVPVSVKMAKEQNIALSPGKISGVCGRLMCCLAFEHVESDGKDDEYSDDAFSPEP